MHPRPLGARPVLVVSLLFVGVALSAVARAEEAPARRQPFGSQGQIVLDDLIGAGERPSHGALTANFGLIGYSTFEQTEEAGGKQTRDSIQSFSLSPTVDVFVAPRVSVGVELDVNWQQERDNGSPGRQRSWTVTALPRLGYVVPLGAGVYFWPRLAIGGGFSEGHGSGSIGPSKATEELGALELPLVLAVHRVVFLSLEPDVVVDHWSAETLQTGLKTTSTSTTAGVGGFVGAGLVL